VYVDTGARTKLWDTCTIDALVITAAGGRVSDVTGAPTDFRGSSLATTVASFSRC
jgi:3'-phosphoadenosine 5'-phosphosulfate (PAPS) 3'-phosphatase